MKKKQTFLNKFKKIFCRENINCLKFLPKALSKAEKIILVTLALAIISGGFLIWRNHWLKNTTEAPTFGGTFTEGIVGEAKDLDKHMARLTGAGLTRLQPNGDVKGDLAENWEILDDGKTYQFKLRQGFFSQDLANQITSKNIWPNIEIGTPADNLITFSFKQPFSPFLYTSTEPIFPYGPYKMIKEEKNKITLEARSDYWQGKPNIEKIVLQLYPNQDELIKAAKGQDITGYIKDSQSDYQMPNSQVFEMPLPQELNLFFNLSKPDLQNVERRKNLRDNVAIDKEINLTLATSENPKNVRIAEEFKNKWKSLKVNLEVKTYDNITLQKEVIPKRDYDLLLFGLDYGADPDPYPFWHSSQINEGRNLSNFSFKQADKLLEEARQTFDFKIREEKYTEFRKILDQEVPFIVIEKVTLRYVASNDIKGFDKIFGFSASDRFLNVNEWYIKSKRVKR